MENPCKRITEAIEVTLVEVAENRYDEEVAKERFEKVVAEYEKEFDELPDKCKELYNICNRFVACMSGEVLVET